MDPFIRIGLPVVLVIVAIVVAVFVWNAFQATAMMETEQRAGPTILTK